MNKRLLALLLAAVMIFSCLPFGAFAIDSNSPKITVVSQFAAPNSSVQVDLKITNNPGIAGAKLTVTYDSKLMLTDSVSNGVFSTLDYTRPGKYESPCSFNWDSESAVANEDGTFLSLTFAVSPDAVQNESLPISVTYRNGDIYNGELDSVTVAVENGAVTVIDYIPGDVNSDKAVNGKDVTLLRRFNAGGYDVTINEAAADVNDDDAINGKDVTLIRRYNAGGYDVELKPHTVRCAHSMSHTAAHSATCTDNGNYEYWYCSKCEKYFSDTNGSYEIALDDTVIKAKGHTVIIDEAVPATYSATGLTQGSHCSVCNTVITKQNIVPMLTKTQYSITYYLSNNDDYLASQNISNPNPTYYTSEDGLKLSNIQVEGYVFDGWYDGEGKNGELVKEISKGTTGNISLYARWSLKPYTITFDSPLVTVPSKTYTVDTGASLSNPSLSGYNFIGWCNDNNKLVTSIPAGTTGNITLHANWTSKRNQTRPVSKLGDPLVFEDTDNGTILFTYEIGTVENIPLSQISDMYQSANGMKQTFSTSESTSTSQSTAKTIANSISNATTNSSSWSLSNDWNDLITVNESYAQEQGWSKEEAETNSKTSTDTYSLNSSSGGSSTTVTNTGLSGTLSQDTSKTISGSDSFSKETGSQFDVSVNNSTTIGVNGKISGNIGVAKGEIGANISNTTDIGVSYGNYDKNQRSQSISASKTGTEGKSTTADISTSKSGSSTWNSSSGYSSSNATSNSTTVSNVLSGKINETKGYGSSHATGGSNSENQSFAVSETENNEYSSTLSYSSATTKTNTKTIELGGENEGYYRFVLAGTAHVFAVVGYDIPTRSYYVYTYSVMDDSKYTFIDYSKNTPNFNDCENGVLPFEVPIYVKKYVDYRVGYTDGLQVNTSTGIIDAYNGTAKTVFIPTYMSVDNIDGNGKPGFVKITGISENAFKGNKSVEAISLGGFVTAIPSNAFSGCTSLKEILAPGVTSIGANAFNGCTALTEFTVPSEVTSLGAGAFSGVNKVNIVASTAEVAQNAVSCGAKNIVLNISSISNELTGVTLSVPSTATYFEAQGGNKTFTNLKIESDAKTTYLNGIILNNTNGTPVKMSSENVTLNGVTVSSNGFGMILTSNATVSLRQINSITSEIGRSILCKNVTLKVADSGVTSKLNVSGDIYVCGTVTDNGLLSITNGKIINVSNNDFAKYLNGVYTLSFNANGGTVSTANKTIYYGEAIGDLPTPTRTGFDFDGWFTQANEGAKISSTTVSSFDSDTTIYAHWKAKSFTASWNTGTGYTISVKRTSSPNKGAATGAISSGAAVYYGDVLSITYTKADYYTLGNKGKTSITVTGNVTSSDIYATATLNALSDWVLSSNVPSGAQIVNTKYKYTHRYYKSSSSSSLSGWTKYDTQRTSWSSWSDWATWNPDNGVRNVEWRSAYDHTEYHYYRWTNSGHTAMYDYKTSNYGCTILEEQWFTYILPIVPGNTYLSYEGTNTQANRWQQAQAPSNYSVDKTWTRDIYRDEWRYQDPVYTYYFYQDKSEESTTKPSGSDYSNIQTWVQYRAK